MRPPKFSVGQKVVCLDGTGWDNPLGLKEPVTDRIYQVAELYWCRIYKEWFIELAEILGCRWDSTQFAPVEDLPAEALAELLEVLEPVTV